MMMLVIVVTRSTGHKIELARESAKNTITCPRILLLGLIIMIARVSMELQRGTGSFCSLYGSSVTRENQYSATLVIVLLMMIMMMITIMIITTKKTIVMMMTRTGVKPLAGRCCDDHLVITCVLEITCVLIEAALNRDQTGCCQKDSHNLES